MPFLLPHLWQFQICQFVEQMQLQALSDRACTLQPGTATWQALFWRALKDVLGKSCKLPVFLVTKQFSDLTWASNCNPLYTVILIGAAAPPAHCTWKRACLFAYVHMDSLQDHAATTESAAISSAADAGCAKHILAGYPLPSEVSGVMSRPKIRSTRFVCWVYGVFIISAALMGLRVTQTLSPSQI